jgi:hypothetical protein
MSLTDTEVKDFTVNLFTQKSERDLQKKVGASNISDPCTKHLAKALLNEPEPEIKYWLGGKIGTAIHSFIEHSISTGVYDNDFEYVIEDKITLGEIDGYGVVNSRPDLVIPNVNHLIDWKTSSRPKIKKLQNLVAGLKDDKESENTLKKYIGQVQLYAWGLNNSGTKIDRASLVFINRDGTYENDIWVYSVDYDESIALALWDRVKYLWKELEDGLHPDSIAPHPLCFKCNVGI